VILTTNLNFQQIGSQGTLTGNVLVVLAAFFWGIDNNLSRPLTVRGSLLHVGSLKSIIGGGLLFTIASLYDFHFIPSTFAISWLLILGVFSVGLSLLLFLFALQQIGAMRTGVIFSTGSLFGAVFAFFVLHEPISLAGSCRLPDARRYLHTLDSEETEPQPSIGEAQSLRSLSSSCDCFCDYEEPYQDYD